MTDGVQAIGPRGPARASRKAGVSRGTVFGLGFTVLAVTAAGAGMGWRHLGVPEEGAAPRLASLASPKGAEARAVPPVAARHERGVRVVAPPVPTTARLHRQAPTPLRHDATFDRHPRLLEPSQVAADASFGPATPVRVAAFEAPEAVVAEAVDTPSTPVPTQVAEASDDLAGPPLPPANAQAALEAALVPTPRARPAYRTILSAPPVAAAKPAPLLAYARPDAGAEEDDVAPQRAVPVQPSRAGNGVAIYDIAAATVYMPNGERLEAHSGLGSLRDDARFAHVKMRGPTPPHTYDLKLRESLFHGVQAIRLTPVGGERQIYNRVGLLAHTYMLGKRGDSNGCVSFKDYKRFLAAFRRGEVKRLVVVKQMGPVSRFASLFGARG